MNSMRPRVFISLWLLVAFLASCGGSGPSFQGRLIAISYVTPLGYGIPDKGGALIELAADPVSGKVISRSLAEDIFAAQVSPDGRRVLYSTEKEIRMRDLQSGNTKVLISEKTIFENELAWIREVSRKMNPEDRPPAESEKASAEYIASEHIPEKCDCLSWAPGGRWFSYKFKNKLYVSDVQGKIRQIWTSLTAPYNVYFDGKKTDTVDVRGKLDCGSWVSPDRFVFQRYVGDLPYEIRAGGGSVDDNCSTLVELGDNPSLTDYGERVYVYDVCQNGLAVIFKDQPYNPPIFVRDYTQIPKAEPRRIGDSAVPDWHFMPDSCRLYSLQSASGNLYFMQFDPETRKISRGPKLGRGDSTALMGYVMHPNGSLIALAEDGPQGSQGGRPILVSIADLGRGRKAGIFKTAPMRYTGWRPLILLAWIPS